MAEFKKKILFLSSGKQLKLYGTSVAIGKTLEVGEGYAPTIFSTANQQVINPHQLTADEIMEIADFTMQCWMDLKSNIRKHGIDNPKIFTES